LVRSYSDQTNQDIRINIPDVPLNLITSSFEGSVRFQGKASWSLHTENKGNSVNLWISFTGSDGKSSGSLLLCVEGSKKVLGILYSATLPVPDPKTINGDFDLTRHEAPLEKALQGVVNAQLVQAMD
jgi:hypothetical protein